jgi:hypothetical protein
VKTLRGYSPCLSAERVPETPVNFTSLSSQELVSLLQPRSLPSGVALLLRVSSWRRELSFPSFAVTSRYVSHRVTRYLLSKQWVSSTRETSLKFPLTASIQAEFNNRAVIPVYQQSSVKRPHFCRHREDSIIPTYSQYDSIVMMFWLFFSSRHHSPHICLTW